MTREILYVVGHKNPDTDSICSAMAYSRLRQLQGVDGVQAARAGNINRQTEFVLEELALPIPPLLVDVHPRVRDVVGEHVVTIPGSAPLARALELFHLHGIRLLPVVDGEKHPQGLLSLKKVSERFLVPSQEKEIRRVLASPASVRQCLRAEPLTLFGEDSVEELNLYVGAMASATFHRKMEGLDLRKMVLVTGDRENIQEKAVELGVRILIVTGNLPVSPEIVAKGREKEVTILSTPFDSATSAWLTRLSTPVGSLAGGEFPTVGLKDPLDDLRLKLLHSSEPGAVVLDGEGKVAAVATKSNLLVTSPIKLILVDHNELSQAVAGAEKVEILEVVDHHRLGNFHTDHPIRFINQPLGSTCTVVATLFRQAGLEPDRATAGLMLAGLLSDTVILKSPTATGTDREMARWLGELSGLDPLEFGQRIFSAGSALAAYPSVRHLILADFKEYEVGDRTFGVGQVEVVSFHEFHAMKGEILKGLEAVRDERHLDTAGLLVTDIVQETSLFLVVGGKELPYVIGYPQIEENLYELPGVLSRKKQLIPHLLKVLKS
jgi:manganese-dependent inorganic pyrophosphatase